MRVLVLSDLHVRGTDDPLYGALLRVLRERARAGDTVVMAGDLFDIFVGNKRVFVDRYGSFFEALKEAGERGVRLHYIEGNHDFLIRRAFAGIPNLEIHSQEVELEVGGKRFYVAHGDTVDRGDYGYRALRLFFRSPVMRAFVAAAPGEWIERIGTGSAERSRRRKPRVVQELPIERREHLRKIFRSFAAERIARGFDFVVLGHCHDLDEMRFTVGGRPGHYMNMGYPRVHGSFVSWSPEDGSEIRREPL